MSLKNSPMEALIKFDDNGEILSLSTGINYASEHEHGFNPLKSFLCKGFESNESIEFRKKEYETKKKSKIRRFFLKEFKYPSPISLYTINKTSNILFFESKEGSDYCAWIFFHPENNIKDEIKKLKNLFPRKKEEKEKDIVAAWSEIGFLIGVRGRGSIKSLKNFYERIKSEKTAFLGPEIELKGKKQIGVVIFDIEKENWKLL